MACTHRQSPSLRPRDQGSRLYSDWLSETRGISVVPAIKCGIRSLFRHLALNRTDELGSHWHVQQAICWRRLWLLCSRSAECAFLSRHVHPLYSRHQSVFRRAYRNGNVACGLDEEKISHSCLDALPEIWRSRAWLRAPPCRPPARCTSVGKTEQHASEVASLSDRCGSIPTPFCSDSTSKSKGL